MIQYVHLVILYLLPGCTRGHSHCRELVEASPVRNAVILIDGYDLLQLRAEDFKSVVILHRSMKLTTIE